MANQRRRGGGRSQRRVSWWSTWWGAGLTLVVTGALVYQPLIWALVYAHIAWTGCAVDCGPADRPLGAFFYVISATLVALPILAMVFAARAWLGWLTGALVAAVAAWLWYLSLMGTL